VTVGSVSALARAIRLGCYANPHTKALSPGKALPSSFLSSLV